MVPAPVLPHAVDARTWVDLLRHHARTLSTKTALTMLANGEVESGHLTYGELDHRARAIAAHLQSMGLAGRCVLLLYPSGLDFVAAFFGCLYAGVIAVPVFPPRFNRNMRRLDHIFEDTQPALVLTTTAMMSRREGAPAMAVIPWLATDTASFIEGSTDSWTPPAIDGGSLAFLQYTSGSTSTPKGVMVTHGNLLANHVMMQVSYDQHADCTFVVWMPLFHDMGLVTGLLQGLSQGAHVVIMPPETFVMKPFRWLQAMSRYKAHSTGGPNFAYDLCVRKVTPEQCQTLDLSSWRLAMNAAEPVIAETLQQFIAKFGPCGFRPETFNAGYGMAEATAFATSGRCDAPPIFHVPPRTVLDTAPPRAKVACGHTCAGGRLLIVDPDSLEPCPPGTIGEIWLAGPHIGIGYWNQPEATARTFQARTAGGGDGPFLRTGDLGYEHEGQLYVAGRIKDIVIICGQNHDPGDIELTVEASHPRIRPHASAAFGITVGDAERLVVLAELARAPRGDATPPPNDAALQQEILTHARREVSEQHGISIHELVLLPPSSLPKTSSGKIQRHAARQLYLDQQLTPVVP